MSNPSTTDATLDSSNNGQVALSFAEQVNALASNVQRDEAGKLAFDETTTEELRVATTAEIRRRDTQASYTKLSQTNKTYEVENQELRKRLSNKVAVSLTEEQQEELDTLKYQDPEAWRKQMNDLEVAASNELNAELQEVQTVASRTGEIENRKVILEQFLDANPGFEINDDVIANDVPPRITKKLEDGAITFEAFLTEVKTYLGTPKKAMSSEASDIPDLGRVGGGATASEAAIATDAITSYANELY